MDGITVQFPGVLALDKGHFDAKPGEVHVLLGENGAGKSTIMKAASFIKARRSSHAASMSSAPAA